MAKGVTFVPTDAQALSFFARRVVRLVRSTTSSTVFVEIDGVVKASIRQADEQHDGIGGYVLEVLVEAEPGQVPDA